jgi:hypothetical protein
VKSVRLHLPAIALVVFSGCSVNGQDANNEEMLIKASALTKVAKAVASAVEFRDAPAHLSEGELLRFAAQHDPEMLEPFRDYVLRVRRAGNATSVLLCSHDRRTGLIEDSGCSAKVDVHLWRRSPRPPCEFQLDLAATCGTR